MSTQIRIRANFVRNKEKNAELPCHISPAIYGLRNENFFTDDEKTLGVYSAKSSSEHRLYILVCDASKYL